MRIAFTGKLRSGKSAAAGRLVYNYGFETVSFGSALKRYADEIFSVTEVSEYKPELITEVDPFGYTYVSTKRKPRKLYQDFGQIMRELDPDIWIRHAEKSVEMLEDFRSTRGIVIDDLRQPNEYEWCRDNGFVIIRLVAPAETRVRRAEIAGDAFDMASLGHDTESHSDGFEVDYEIINDGTYEDLERKVDEIISKLQATAAEI